MTIGPATVVIIAEHKEPMPATVTDGITLFTTHVRRADARHPRPEAQRPQQAERHPGLHPGLHAGADEALMLDPHGLRRHLQQHPLLHRHQDGEVWTSDGRFCLGRHHPRQRARGLPGQRHPARETTFSLTDVYSAAEAFVTGTFAGVVPVRSVDGRTIGSGARGPVVERLQRLYQEHVAADVAGRGVR